MRKSIRLIFALVAVGAVAASFFVDVHVGLGFMLRPPWPELQRFWLPLTLFLLLVLCWLVRHLLHLLDARPTSFEFEDIDAAWSETLQFFEEFDIDIRATPVFLVLGHDNGSFFAGNDAQITRIPLARSVDFAIHLQGRGEAVLIHCPGAAGAGADAWQRVTPTRQHDSNELTTMHEVLARAQKEGRGLDQLTAAEKETISSAIEEEHHSDNALPENHATKQRLRLATARLRHLCALIAQERQPYCPLNGILVLTPFAASESDERSEYTAACIQQDLHTARRTLQVDCPVYLAVSDLQEARGADEFVELMSATNRQQAFGMRFPLLPDLDPHETAAMLEDGVTWVCCTLAPKHVSKLLRPIAAQTGKQPQTAKLFRFLLELRQRSRRFGHIVRQGTELPDGAAVMAAGFYLAASDADGIHAFVAGVLREMHANQNYVSWTPETMGRNTRARRVASVGFAALLTVLASASFLYWRS